MELLKRTHQEEEECSLLSEMEMLHVYGGKGDDEETNTRCSITNNGCINNLPGCGGEDDNAVITKTRNDNTVITKTKDGKIITIVNIEICYMNDEWIKESCDTTETNKKK